MPLAAILQHRTVKAVICSLVTEEMFLEMPRFWHCIPLSFILFYFIFVCTDCLFGAEEVSDIRWTPPPLIAVTVLNWKMGSWVFNLCSKCFTHISKWILHTTQILLVTFMNKVSNAYVYCMKVQMRQNPLVFKRQESDFLDLNSSFATYNVTANHLTSLSLSFLYC